MNDLTLLSLEELLEEYYWAREELRDMELRSDYVKWSEEAEIQARKYVYKVEGEFERRINNK